MTCPMLNPATAAGEFAYPLFETFDGFRVNADAGVIPATGKAEPRYDRHPQEIQSDGRMTSFCLFDETEREMWER